MNLASFCQNAGSSGRATQLIRPAPGAEALHAGAEAELDRRIFGDPPSVGADFNATPKLIGQVEVDQAVMLGEADRDLALRTIELSLRLKHIDGCVQRGCWNGWHASGYISALSLRQFCGVSKSNAVAYWIRNTDNNDGPEYDDYKNNRRVRALYRFDDRHDNAAKDLSADLEVNRFVAVLCDQGLHMCKELVATSQQKLWIRFQLQRCDQLRFLIRIVQQLNKFLNTLNGKAVKARHDARVFVEGSSVSHARSTVIARNKDRAIADVTAFYVTAAEAIPFAR
jgi:hypothetical protein